MLGILTSDSIDQVGLAGDETGTIKFTKWSKSDLPTLEANGNYLLKNVVTDEWGGRVTRSLRSYFYHKKGAVSKPPLFDRIFSLY